MAKEKKDNPEVKTQDNQEEPDQASQEGGSWINLASPEGIVMLFCALCLDMIGWILLMFGLDDFGVTDFLGILLVGGWSFLRLGTFNFGGKTKKTGKRFFLATIVELVPWLGSLSPSWTIFVASELKNS